MTEEDKHRIRMAIMDADKAIRIARYTIRRVLADNMREIDKAIESISAKVKADEATDEEEEEFRDNEREYERLSVAIDAVDDTDELEYQLDDNEFFHEVGVYAPHEYEWLKEREREKAEQKRQGFAD